MHARRGLGEGAALGGLHASDSGYVPSNMPAPCSRPCRADQARPRRQLGSFPAKMGIAPRELQAVQFGQAL
jgi:hypothetical protein